MSAEYRVVNRVSEGILPTTVRNISGLTLDVIMRLFASRLSELQAWAVLHVHQSLKGLQALGQAQSTSLRGINMRNVVAALDGEIYFTAGQKCACD